MPSIRTPAIKKRMVSRVSGGQSRTAIFAAAKAELHKKQNAAMGTQLIPEAAGAFGGRATGVAFIKGPGERHATQGAGIKHSARAQVR
ncbi:hypothetical protein HMPREF0004_0839 [Achromobacter piechaudii ATCC 43553]|uniref:Uncharacterized protein n=1 Tax=Achromobacter piechaudii ATCC 43553 TaxID=742159 RepID=D4X5U2_9BURK|nr:hypothetical protein HMPREF0004_0839 [Achromobacter piechaudii ATCC 43553]